MNTNLDWTMADDPERNLFSLGWACQFLQCLPGQIRVLAEDCGAKVSETRDGIPFFNGVEMQKIADCYKKVAAEIEGKLSATPNN